MKKTPVFWIAVGLSISIISPSLTQAVTDKNVILIESTSRGNDLTVSNIGENEHERDEETAAIESFQEDLPKFDEDINIIIEENNPDKILEVGPATDNTLILPDNNVLSFDNEIVPMRDDDYYYNDLINRDPSEIMDTAAGFVPIPIFRKKHKSRKPQKPYVSRRYFKRPYAYRRYYYFYPYYGYYPSSLRYY